MFFICGEKFRGNSCHSCPFLLSDFGFRPSDLARVPSPLKKCTKTLRVEHKSSKTLRVELTSFPPLCHTCPVMEATKGFSRPAGRARHSVRAALATDRPRIFPNAACQFWCPNNVPLSSRVNSATWLRRLKGLPLQDVPTLSDLIRPSKFLTYLPNQACDTPRVLALAPASWTAPALRRWGPGLLLSQVVQLQPAQPQSTTRHGEAFGVAGSAINNQQSVIIF